MNTAVQSIHVGLVHLAYGVTMQDKADFRSPFALDEDDLWFDYDFDHLIDNWIEDVLKAIESDITSVDSTNLSEQRSE